MNREGEKGREVNVNVQKNRTNFQKGLLDAIQNERKMTSGHWMNPVWRENRWRWKSNFVPSSTKWPLHYPHQSMKRLWSKDLWKSRKWSIGRTKWNERMRERLMEWKEKWLRVWCKKKDDERKWRVKETMSNQFDLHSNSLLEVKGLTSDAKQEWTRKTFCQKKEEKMRWEWNLRVDDFFGRNDSYSRNFRLIQVTGHIKGHFWIRFSWLYQVHIDELELLI